jgi:isocitrate lyase
VVSKRGNLVQAYASNVQAKKLWALLMKHNANSTASYTYGVLDPVQIIQMNKYIETVYVSGWQSSSTASTSNEPGPDLADYPMVKDTLDSPSRTRCPTRWSNCFLLNNSMIENNEKNDLI